MPPNLDPDAALMLRVKRGDRAAFAGLVEKYQQPVMNFIYRSLRDESEAEDLAQKIRAILEPQGTWVQYSYRIHKRRTRGTSRFQLLASKIVWLNLPPARVSVFQK